VPGPGRAAGPGGRRDEAGRPAPGAPALALLAALSLLAPARAARAGSGEDLRKDTLRAAAITASALALDVALSSVNTTACRICTPDRLDASARDALRWRDPTSAARASDLLANVAIPALAGADALRSTGSFPGAARDGLVLAEAASLASLATEGAKDGFARRRPGLPTSGPASPAGNHSLWSGHTSLAFSIAVAQATQDTLRGDPAAPWAWAVGLTLASAVGYLRVAGDAHWLSDVLAGAVAGSAFGVAVPLAEKRLVGVTLAPAPGGIAIRF